MRVGSRRLEILLGMGSCGQRQADNCATFGHALTRSSLLKSCVFFPNLVMPYKVDVLSVLRDVHDFNYDE